MEQRISGIEDTIEDMDTWSKKMLINVKKKKKKNKNLAQSIQEIWETIKRPNLKIIGIEEDSSPIVPKGQNTSSAKSQKKTFLT